MKSQPFASAPSIKLNPSGSVVSISLQIFPLGRSLSEQPFETLAKYLEERLGILGYGQNADAVHLFRLLRRGGIGGKQDRKCRREESNYLSHRIILPDARCRRKSMLA